MDRDEHYCAGQSAYAIGLPLAAAPIADGREEWMFGWLEAASERGQRIDESMAQRSAPCQ